jgi:hypothetical protein
MATYKTCKICIDPRRGEIDAALLSGALSDRAIGRRFNLAHATVSRHKQDHILAVANAQLRLVTRAEVERQQREELLAAAASDAPSTSALVEAHLGLRATTLKLVDIDETLVWETAHAARVHNATGVAALSGQRLRGIELGAKIAGIYPTPTAAAGGERGPKWEINMIFPNAGRTETITVMTQAGGGEEGEAGDVIEETVEE